MPISPALGIRSAAATALSMWPFLVAPTTGAVLFTTHDNVSMSF
ncbi:hypothetical protein AB0J74_20740 [Asanoa sp. NPDC049573]